MSASSPNAKQIRQRDDCTGKATEKGNRPNHTDRKEHELPAPGQAPNQRVVGGYGAAWPAKADVGGLWSRREQAQSCKASDSRLDICLRKVSQRRPTKLAGRNGLGVAQESKVETNGWEHGLPSTGCVQVARCDRDLTKLTRVWSVSKITGSQGTERLAEGGAA